MYLVDVIWVSTEDQTLTNEGVINGAFTSDAEQSLSFESAFDARILH